MLKLDGVSINIGKKWQFSAKKIVVSHFIIAAVILAMTAAFLIIELR